MSEKYDRYSTAMESHDKGCGMTDAVIEIRRKVWETPLCKCHRNQTIDGFLVCLRCGCVSEFPEGPASDGATAADCRYPKSQPEATVLATRYHQRLVDALRESTEALRTCYDVCDYPGGGISTQDIALNAGRALLAEIDKEAAKL